ncbi:MAG: UDP-N-acetylmuramate dehydrogenase [Gemmatimonadota bacterium]
MSDRLDVESVGRRLEGEFGPDRVGRGVPLAPFTTFGIGGPADLFFRARTVEELVRVTQLARDMDAPSFLLGRGANILVADAGVRALVIHNEAKGISWVEETVVRAESGVETFPDLIEATVARGMAGLHHFVGIPSTVGGAMWQNLHFLSPAPERSRTVFLEEFVERADIFTAEGARRTVGAGYFEFGYDTSVLHHREDVVLSVDFRLAPLPEGDLRRVMRENLVWRAERHPDLALFPCVGSIFQKIQGVGAGRLIDQCGLKGHVHPSGRAAIFDRHANIIVNLGGARASDVRELMELSQRTVSRELGHELVPEIGLIGDFGQAG